MRGFYFVGLNTFKDAIRQKIVLLISFVALALTSFSIYAMKMDLGNDALRFVANFTSGALGFFGAVIAITSICQLIYSEIENKTVATLLAKPIGFSGFIFGKIFGEAMLLALFCALISLVGAGALLVASARIAAIPETMMIGEVESLKWLGFAAFVFLAYLRLMVIAALSCFICASSRSLMFAIVVSFMACAASLMSYSDFMSGANWAITLASVFFPNLAMYENSVEFMFAGVDAVRFFAACAYSLIYIFAFGLLSVWSFKSRDI